MDPAELRAAIPTCQDVAYLNTGASSPTPRPVLDAVQGFVERHGTTVHATENPYHAAQEAYDESRTAIADFVGADPAEVALTQSTTDGINVVAPAIDFEPGDRVVITDVEHHSNVLPWRRLRDTRGIEVEVVPTDHGRVDLGRVAEAVEGATLLSTSAIEWEYGRQLPVSELVEVAHDAGAHVVIDAVQSVGQRPVDVHEWGADVVVGAGHKWLLGPWSAGFCYVREGVEEWLVPERIGYRSVVDPGSESYEYKPGAARLEVATADPSPHVGMARAIDLVTDVGLDTVQSRIGRLTDRFKEQLPDDRLLSPREYESGLVTFAAEDPEATVERLADHDVVVRSIPPIGAVRASIHAFNTAEEVDRLASLVTDRP